MTLILRYNWNETHRQDERMTILKSFFRNALVLPNQSVLNLLMGHMEVALQIDVQKRFVGYEVGQLGVVWICAKCEQTVTFDDLEKYKDGVEEHYLDHLSGCEQE